MSTKTKFTRWFSARQHPARVGLYEVRYDGESENPACFRFWNGYLWMKDQLGGETLFGWSKDKWRGLAEPPK